MKNQFVIEGIKCEGCINRIKNVLSKEKSVISYSLSLEDKTLLIETKKNNDIEKIIEKINNLGFEVKDI